MRRYLSIGFKFYLLLQNHACATQIVIMLHWFSYTMASLILLTLLSKYIYNESSTLNMASLSESTRELSIFIIALSSIAGIPPFFGFWTKTLLLIYISNVGGLILIVAAWVFSLAALLFYINTIRTAIIVCNEAQPSMKSNTIAAYCLFEQLLLFLIIFGYFFLSDFALLAALILL